MANLSVLYKQDLRHNNLKLEIRLLGKELGWFLITNEGAEVAMSVDEARLMLQLQKVI